MQGGCNGVNGNLGSEEGRIYTSYEEVLYQPWKSLVSLLLKY